MKLETSTGYVMNSAFLFGRQIGDLTGRHVDLGAGHACFALSSVGEWTNESRLNPRVSLASKMGLVSPKLKVTSLKRRTT